MEIVIFVLSPISGRLADRYGSRVLSSVGLALNAAALFWFSTLNEKSSYSAVLISLLLFGFGMRYLLLPMSAPSWVPSLLRSVESPMESE